MIIYWHVVYWWIWILCFSTCNVRKYTALIGRRHIQCSSRMYILPCYIIFKAGINWNKSFSNLSNCSLSRPMGHYVSNFVVFALAMIFYMQVKVKRTLLGKLNVTTLYISRFLKLLSFREEVYPYSTLYSAAIVKVMQVVAIFKTQNSLST